MCINITNITLSYKHTLYIEIAYTNCLTGSLNIYISKTLVFSFNILSIHLSIDGKLYNSNSLSLNKSINLTSIGL